MKKYEEATVEVIKLEDNDIICTSGCSGTGGMDTEDTCLSGE